jgi:hypothetical protein
MQQTTGVVQGNLAANNIPFTPPMQLQLRQLQALPVQPFKAKRYSPYG